MSIWNGHLFAPSPGPGERGPWPPRPMRSVPLGSTFMHHLLCPFSACPALWAVSSLMFRIMADLAFSRQFVPTGSRTWHTVGRDLRQLRNSRTSLVIVLALSSPMEMGWRSCSAYPSRWGCGTMKRRVNEYRDFELSLPLWQLQVKCTSHLWSPAVVASELSHLAGPWVLVCVGLNLTSHCFSLQGTWKCSLNVTPLVSV